MLNLGPARVSYIAVLSGLLVLTTAVVKPPESVALLANEKALPTETIAGEGAWVSQTLPKSFNPQRPIVVKVWFDQQFLGDGKAYQRRAKEFSKRGRRELRKEVVATLQAAGDKSYAAAEAKIKELLKDETMRDFQRHWIVNGFTCTTTAAGLNALKQIPGVRKIFLSPRAGGQRISKSNDVAPKLASAEKVPFDPSRFKHPWYIRSLLADRVWKDLGITGKDTLNIISDHNFLFTDHLTENVYRNPQELAGNGKDDDGNGLIDDCYGFNFALNSPLLTTRPNATDPSSLHGTMCTTIVCGTGTEKSPYEFGIAPEARWAGLIAGTSIEPAVEWAVLHEADTYSMSFSIPNLGEYRSHWRKVMEHGSFCGVYFVSGAGNFAQTVAVPVQMRVPEDIPDVVFAAAGVQRDLSRTAFSSKGPVKWETEHYQDGTVQKPEVCAFNHGLPLLLPDGSVRPAAINGNSFAGPMFCGSIALMLSADPDLLPWDLKEIITTTATDVGPQGIDYETGHGLINCYRAVKEVLRRKAVREGNDPTRYTGRTDGDELDMKALTERLGPRRLTVGRILAGGIAAKADVKVGDVILKIDDTDISTARDIQQAFIKRRGKPVTLIVERAGKEIEIKLNAGSPGLGVAESFGSPVFE